jgi:putative endonuclease
MKRGYVYLLASRRNGTRYVGATSDVSKRIQQHRDGVVDGFTKRYGAHRR